MFTTQPNSNHVESLESRKLLAVTPIADNMVIASDGGQSQFVFINADAHTQARVTSPMSDPEWPSLSPDRTQILCTGEVADNSATQEIFTCNVDGTGLRQLTNNSAQDTEPAFSADGSKVVFVSKRDGNDEIYVMNADGSAQTRLTNSSADDTDPHFSPDGSKIVFDSNSSGKPQIYTIDAATGENLIRLTNDNTFDTEPVYSPDGGRIAYNIGGDIWMIDARGTDAGTLAAVQVTHTGGVTGDSVDAFAFSPDGTQIAYQEDESEAGSFITVASAEDGSNAVHIANSSFGSGLAWASAPTFAGQFRGIITVNGTPGNDAISFTDDGMNVRFTLNGKTEAFGTDHLAGIEIFAGAGNDLVDGSQGDTAFYASGDAGNDELIGGMFNDTLTGGAGKNTLMGNDGDDRLNGSGGRDFLYGDNGNDRLYGNAGNDYLVGGAGVDRIWGGDGDDLLSGNTGNDKMYGEAGNDQLIGGDGNDICNGGLGIDTLNGQKGTDSSDNDAADLRSSIELLL